MSVITINTILRCAWLKPLVVVVAACLLSVGTDLPARCQKPFYMPDSTDKDVLKKGLAQFEKEPNNEQAFYLAVRYYMANKDFKSSRSLVKSAAEAHPTWASPYYFQSIEAEQSLNDAQALRSYEKCLQLNPAWIKVAVQYAEALRLDYKKRQAIVKCNEALAICARSPSDKRVQKDIGALNQIKGQSYFDLMAYPQAIAVLSEMTKTERNLKAETLLARACVGCKKYEQAIKVSTKTLALFPQDPYSRFARATAYATLKQPDKSMADLDYMLAHNIKETNRPASDLEMERSVRSLRLSIYKARGDRASAIKELAAMKKLESESFSDTPFQHATNEWK